MEFAGTEYMNRLTGLSTCNEIAMAAQTVLAQVRRFQGYFMPRCLKPLTQKEQELSHEEQGNAWSVSNDVRHRAFQDRYLMIHVRQ